MIVDVPGIPLRRVYGSISYVLVDAADFVWLNEYRWGGAARGYASRYDSTGRQRIYMHREIMGLARDDERVVDHINGEPLDNRRANLRIVTQAENAQNTSAKGGTSTHRGVSWDRRRGAWRAQIRLRGRLRFLGYFDEESEAAAAVDDLLATAGLARTAVTA